MKTSLTSGSSTEAVHVPKLWYFDHLKFLADQDTPRKSTTTSSLLDDMTFSEEEVRKILYKNINIGNFMF